MTFFTPTLLATGISLPLGEPLNVMMNDFPSGGFRWLPEIIGSNIRLNTTIGLRRFNFATVSRGMTMLTLNKLHPWGEDPTPVARHLIMVNVIAGDADNA